MITESLAPDIDTRVACSKAFEGNVEVHSVCIYCSLCRKCPNPDEPEEPAEGGSHLDERVKGHF